MIPKLTAALPAAALLALPGCDVSFNVGNNSSATSGSQSEAPAPTTRRFVNSMQHARSEVLRRHYVDFSFDYPAGWSMTAQPTDGSAVNYVRVAAPPIDGYEPFAVHVGYAYGTGDAASDRASMERALPQIAEDFGRSMPDYRIVAMGPEQVGGQPTLGWRFTATGPGVKGGAPAQIYGRGDILLPPGATRGVTLVSMASSRTEEVRDAGQVGETGTLQAILDSFALGAAQPNPDK